MFIALMRNTSRTVSSLAPSGGGCADFLSAWTTASPAGKTATQKMLVCLKNSAAMPIKTVTIAEEIFESFFCCVRKAWW